MVNGSRPRAGAGACETSRKLSRAGRLVVLIVFATLALSGLASAQAPAHPSSDTASHASAPESSEPAAQAGEGHGATEEHAQSSPWDLAGKLVNFALLIGTLVYLLRAPISNYLGGRVVQVRHDLEHAAEMKEDATRQIAAIDAKLAQLPRELDNLRARGREEVAAEEARINEAAEAERTRLLEQTRREIDLQLRIARRELVTHAADLSVQVARDRIRREITDADQQRLVDRYLEQVRTKRHE